MYRARPARLAKYGFCLDGDWQDTPIEAVLGPIGLTVLALLTQADLSRIKQCGVQAGCFSTRAGTKAVDGRNGSLRQKRKQERPQANQKA
jgi:hypothetical protein